MFDQTTLTAYRNHTTWLKCTKTHLRAFRMSSFPEWYLDTVRWGGERRGWNV